MVIDQDLTTEIDVCIAEVSHIIPASFILERFAMLLILEVLLPPTGSQGYTDGLPQVLSFLIGCAFFDHSVSRRHAVCFAPDT